MLLATTGNAIVYVDDAGDADWIPWVGQEFLFGIEHVDDSLWLTHRDGVTRYVIEDGQAWPFNTYHARGHLLHEMVNGLVISPDRKAVYRATDLYTPVHDLSFLTYPNGLGMRDGSLRYVSALVDGVIYDLDTEETIEAGLRPHSPRWHEDALWWCRSGTGELVRDSEVVALLPGFTRGLAFDDQYAYVGTSVPGRSLARYGDRTKLPVYQRPHMCGLHRVDLRSGTAEMITALPHYEQVYDLQFTPGYRPLPPGCREVLGGR